MKYRTIFVDRSATHALRDGWSCGEAVAINVECYIEASPDEPDSWLITGLYVEANCVDDFGDKAWCWVEVQPHGTTGALYAKLCAHLRQEESATIGKQLKLAPLEADQAIPTRKQITDTA
jgi:hypothetical protein